MMFVPFIVSLVLFRVATAFPAWQYQPDQFTGGILKRKILLAEAQQTLNLSPVQLTNISLACTHEEGTTHRDCILSYDWFDPNSVPENTVNSCSCNSTFSWDDQGGKNESTADTNYVTCWEDGEGSIFEMKFLSFNSPSNFSLEIAHQYKDDQNFAAPYDYPMTFAQPSFNLPSVVPDGVHELWATNDTVNATIVAISD